MAALAHDNLFYFQPSGDIRMLNRDAGELNIIVPQAVVDSIITGSFRR